MRVGPKFRLPPRSKDVIPNPSPLTTGENAVLRQYLRTGPKMRLPPRSYDSFAVQVLPAATVGFIPQGGPGEGPGNPQLQFITPPRSTQIPGVFVSIGGILQSNSLFYAPLALATLKVGFIPKPGPGVNPFTNTQFTTFPYATSKPSSTIIAVTGGQSLSNSLLFGAMGGAGTLAAELDSYSTLYAQLDGIAAGVMGGILQSNSTFYATLTAVGELDGLLQSNSLIYGAQVGSGFQPFVPNTPVLDVRLNAGYEPWTVRPAKTIG